MYSSIAQIVIENEKNDYRFENFVREICGKHEGIDFVPTSQSWDLGRDARATAAGKGSHRNLICATLNKDVNAKVDADLLRVTATSSPDRLIYCSSQKLSEKNVDEITQIIRRHAPSGSVLVLGAIQLGVLAEKYPDVFEKHYHAEAQATGCRRLPHIFSGSLFLSLPSAFQTLLPDAVLPLSRPGLRPASFLLGL